MLPAVLATVQSSPLCAAQITAAGAASGKYSLQHQDEELVFMGERCRDEETLRVYGGCEPWIVQVRQRLKHVMLVPSSGHRFTWPSHLQNQATQRTGHIHSAD